MLDMATVSSIPETYMHGILNYLKDITMNLHPRVFGYQQGSCSSRGYPIYTHIQCHRKDLLSFFAKILLPPLPV
jgi:hypothetical protein